MFFCETWGWLVTCELYIYILVFRLVQSKTLIGWTPFIYIPSPQSLATHKRGSAHLGKQCTNYLLHSNSIMPLASQNIPLNNNFLSSLKMVQFSFNQKIYKIVNPKILSYLKLLKRKYWLSFVPGNRNKMNWAL